MLNPGTLVFTAVLILGMAAWIRIQVTAGGSSQGAGGMPAGLWSIDADGDARARPAIEVPADALGMAAGPGGVWIIEPDGVVQLQPAKGTRRKIPLPGRPTTIEIDAELGVWIGGQGRGGQGILWNIDPTTGRIVHSFALPDRPESLAVAASASPPAVWVISPAVATIHQIDAMSGKIVGSNYFGGHMSDITTDSSVAWVAFDQDHTVEPVPSLALPSPFFHEGQKFVVPGTDALAVTKEMLWVLDEEGERVFPVDLVTGRVETPISVGSRPTSLALDEGFLWVANEQSVSRIDGTSRRLSTIAFPGRLSFIAATRGPGTTVWVLAQRTA